MPFGKHKGEEVADLDVGYLQWLQSNVKLYGALNDEVEGVLFQSNNDIDDNEVIEIVGEWPQ